MKKLLFAITFTVFVYTALAQVGIGTTTPDASSQLDITATDKGILIPRMTIVQRTAIPNPAEGLIVYQTDDVIGFYYFNGNDWMGLLDTGKKENPVGIIITFPIETVPNGYLECNGAAVSRTVYADLFYVIGTRYGSGDGSTTFNLPDYRGQFLRAYDHGAGIDPNATSRTDSGNGTFGDAVGTQQSFLILSHNHVVDPPSTNTNSVGNHSHTIPILSGITSYSGSHTHPLDLQPQNTNNNTTNHRHKIHYNKVTGVVFPIWGGGTETIVTDVDISGANNFVDINVEDHPHHHNVFGGGAITSNDEMHQHAFSTEVSSTGALGSHSHTIDVASNNTAYTGGQETRAKNISAMYCIKY